MRRIIDERLEVRYIKEGAERWDEDNRARSIAELTAIAANGRASHEAASGTWIGG